MGKVWSSTFRKETVKISTRTSETAVKGTRTFTDGPDTGLGPMVTVETGIEVAVGVAVACATVTVAPTTGTPVTFTACPLLPAAPVTLNM